MVQTMVIFLNLFEQKLPQAQPSAPIVAGH